MSFKILNRPVRVGVMDTLCHSAWLLVRQHLEKLPKLEPRITYCATDGMEMCVRWQHPYHSMDSVLRFGESCVGLSMGGIDYQIYEYANPQFPDNLLTAIKQDLGDPWRSL